MAAESCRGSRAWLVLLSIALCMGCTTNLTPPSGPVGTEVCFDPAPINGWAFGAGDEHIPCGWWVYFDSGDVQGSAYTYEPCVEIPEYFAPGDEISIRINGDEGGIKCSWVDVFQRIPWVPGYTLFGSFSVTE